MIDGFDVGERATDGRGQVLAPWPNRLTDGYYEYRGRPCQAPLNEIGRHDAIHGLVRWLDWTLVERDPAAVTLACAVRPQPGYEWHLHLQITYALDESGLTVTLEAVNADRDPAPFGVGSIPTSRSARRRSTARPDRPCCRLRRSGRSGRRDDVDRGGRDPARLPAAAQDRTARAGPAFSDLVVGRDGRAVARLGDPADGRSVELWVDHAFRHLMVYTGDLVGEPHRRRTAVAIEPMTCPPDAFRTGVDLLDLEPGTPWRCSWGLARSGRVRCDVAMHPDRCAGSAGAVDCVDQRADRRTQGLGRRAHRGDIRSSRS